VLGEPSLALLRKDELTVDQHVVLGLLAGDDLGGRGRALVDLGRETRSPPVIPVSDGAVVDLDAHARTLPRRVVSALRG
jgi:hypothetical protein